MRLQKKRSGNPTPRFKAAPMPPKWRFNGLSKRAPPSYSLHLADKKRAPVTGARSTAPPLTPVSGRRFRAVRAKKAASAPVFIGSRILTLRAKQPRPRRRFNGLLKHTPVPTLPQTDEARPLNLFPSTGIKDTLSPFAPGSGGVTGTARPHAQTLGVYARLFSFNRPRRRRARRRPVRCPRPFGNRGSPRRRRASGGFCPRRFRAFPAFRARRRSGRPARFPDRTD